MSFTAGGSTPQLTIADATVQNTAALPLTGGSVSADITVNGLTVGRGAGAVSTNTAVGASALNANTSGANNTSIGTNSGLLITTGSQNTSIGSSSGNTNLTGSYNTFVGYSSGNGNGGSHSENVGVGASSFASITTGGQNVAIGRQALALNTTASNNTAVGYQAGYTGTTSSYNTYLGYQAGYFANNTSATTYNCFVGSQAGYSVTTGGNNMFFGTGAGYYVTTGGNNTIIGNYNGNQGGLDIRTASNYIVLSDGAGNPAAYRSTTGSWYLQNLATSGLGGLNILYPNASPNASNSAFFACADSTANRFIVWSNGNVINQNNSYGAISDAKLKHNITLSGSQWNDVKALGSLVKKYSLITDETNTQQIGWIAQDAQTVSPGLVYSTPDKDIEGNLTGESTLGINYSVAYMKAFKALSEALVRIEQLETQVTALQTKVGV